MVRARSMASPDSEDPRSSDDEFCQEHPHLPPQKRKLNADQQDNDLQSSYKDQEVPPFVVLKRRRGTVQTANEPGSGDKDDQELASAALELERVEAARMEQIAAAAIKARGAMMKSVQRAAQQFPPKPLLESIYRREKGTGAHARRIRNKVEKPLQNQKPSMYIPSMFLHESREALDPSLVHPRSPLEQENSILLVQDIGKQYQLAVKESQLQVRDNRIKAKDAEIAALQATADHMQDQYATLAEYVRSESQKNAALENTTRSLQGRVSWQTQMLEWALARMKDYEKLLQDKDSVSSKKDLELKSTEAELAHMRSQLRHAQRDAEKLSQRDFMDLLWELIKPFFAVPQQSKHVFPFMKLPGEIRNMVYENSLVLPRPIDFWPIIPDDAPRGTDHLTVLRQDVKHINTALMQVCRQVNHEATPILYAKNRFRFSDRGGWTILDGFLWHIGPNVNFLTSLTVTCPQWVGTVIETAYPDMKGEMRLMLSRFNKTVLDAPNGPSSEFNFAYKRAGDVLLKLKNLQHFNILITHDMYLQHDRVLQLADMLTDRDEFMLPTDDWQPLCKPKRSFVVIRRATHQPPVVLGRHVDCDFFMGRASLKLASTSRNDDNLTIKTAEYGTSQNKVSFVIDGGEDEADVVLPVIRDLPPRLQEPTFKDVVGTVLVLMCATYMYNTLRG